MNGDINKILALVNITNELTKRVQDYMHKEAQYTERAKEVADEIIDNLIEAHLINQDDANTIKEKLVKSASSALDTLRNIAVTVNESPPRLGTQYTPQSFTYATFAVGRHAAPQVKEYEGIVIDPSKLL